MAANFITVNSQYKPFSFQEMLQPYLLYGQVYKEAEQGLQQMMDKASELDSLKYNDNDKEAYQMYQNYVDGLKKNIDALSTMGYNPSVSRGLLNNRAEFAKNIVPINQQILKRNELSKQQDMLMAQNPDIRFDNDYHTVGIPDMIRNPSMGFRSIDLGKITQKVAAIAEHLAKTKLSEPKYRHILNGQMWLPVMQQGYSNKEIAQAIASGFGNGAPKELKEIYENVLKSTGYNKWNSKIQNEIVGAINYGMLAGVGGTTYGTPVEDKYTTSSIDLDNYKAKKQIDLDNLEAQLRITNGGSGNGDTLVPNQFPFKTDSINIPTNNAGIGAFKDNVNNLLKDNALWTGNKGDYKLASKDKYLNNKLVECMLQAENMYNTRITTDGREIGGGSSTTTRDKNNQLKSFIIAKGRELYNTNKERFEKEYYQKRMAIKNLYGPNNKITIAPNNFRRLDLDNLLSNNYSENLGGSTNIRTFRTTEGFKKNFIDNISNISDLKRITNMDNEGNITLGSSLSDRNELLQKVGNEVHPKNLIFSIINRGNHAGDLLISDGENNSYLMSGSKLGSSFTDAFQNQRIAKEGIKSILSEMKNSDIDNALMSGYNPLTIAKQLYYSGKLDNRTRRAIGHLLNAHTINLDAQGTAFKSSQDVIGSSTIGNGTLKAQDINE